MKHDERNFLFPPEELTEQSEWNTLWIAWMYDRTQNIALGERKEFIFRHEINAQICVNLSRSGKPCPALVFDTKRVDSRAPGYVFSCEILEITNEHFGSVKQIETFLSTFEVLLESGRKLIVHSEEMPGVLWDEETKTWLQETQKYDWSMSVRLRILDRDPRKLFIDNPNTRGFPPQSDYAQSRDTPLFLAARSGNRDAVETLLRDGVNPNIQNHTGWSPLHTAAVQGYTELVRLLLDHGAYVDPRTKQGWTPLFLTAGSGHVDIAKLLLDAKADVYAEDAQGNLPLHNAQKNGYQKIVKLLKHKMNLQY